MEIRNRELYRKLSSYIQGVRDNSLDWRPHTPRFQALIDFLITQKPIVETVDWWGPEGTQRDRMKQWVLSFGDAYQNVLSNFAWDEHVFDKVYERFEHFLYSRNLIVTWVSPVYLFECRLNRPIELDKAVDLIPRGFNRNIQRLLDCFETSEKRFYEKYDWCITVQVEISKSDPIDVMLDSTNVSRQVENAATSLRLLRSEMISFGPLYSDQASPFAGRHGGLKSKSYPMFKEPSDEHMFFSRYVLEEKNIDSLKRLYQQLAKLDRGRREFLSIVISRFNDSYERELERDKLIDLCIALESLYVRELDELPYRLALRCAYFLESDENARKKIFQALRKIYRSRSRIVHGSRKQLGKFQLSELADDAEDYVRRSLRKLLSSVEYIDKLRKEPKEDELPFLDNMIFRAYAGDC